MEHLQVLCAFKIHITDGFLFSHKIRPLSEITDLTTRKGTIHQAMQSKKNAT